MIDDDEIERIAAGYEALCPDTGAALRECIRDALTDQSVLKGQLQRALEAISPGYVRMPKAKLCLMPKPRPEPLDIPDPTTHDSPL
jgi:hypothetical protein